MTETEAIATLDDSEQAQGYAKIGFLGFGKTGKSYTAALLACAMRRHFKLDGHIAMFDTETGSLYLKPTVLALIGKKLLAKRSRSFDEMLNWGHNCVKGNVAVAIVDSITHPWRELCDSYLVAKNAARKSKGLPPQKRLAFQDWNVLKPRWGKWTDFYLNSAMHIIICGRAGFIYEFVETDGEKELITKGIKMKTETEFGFEPSLLAEFQCIERREPVLTIARQVTITGDRFSVIDGKMAEFPNAGSHAKNMERVWDFFRPHIEMLTPGALGRIASGDGSKFEFAASGYEARQAEAKEHEVLLDEIQMVLVKHYPAATGKDKAIKIKLIAQLFGNESWLRVKELSIEELRSGLKKLRTRLAQEEKNEIRP